MISLFTGEILGMSSAVEISGNTCSHNCFYCYANNKKTKRVMKLQSVINHLTKPEPTNIVHHLLAQGFPIAFSNNTDPFSKNNYVQTLALAPYLMARKNGLYMMTKGGYGIKEFLDIAEKFGKQNISFYISITSNDDQLSEIIEPGAPTPTERIALAEYLVSKGYFVIAALNPLSEDWLPKTQLPLLVQRLKNAGVKHYRIEELSLNIGGMRSKGIDNSHKIPQSLLVKYKEYASWIKTATDKEFYDNAYVWEATRYIESEGLTVGLLSYAYRTKLYDDLREHLGSSFFIFHDFVNYSFELLSKNNGNGVFVFFCDFWDSLTRHMGSWIETFRQKNLGTFYIMRDSFGEWRGNLKVQAIDNYKDLMRFYWNSDRSAWAVMNHFFYRHVGTNDEFYTDSDGDYVFYFDGTIDFSNSVKYFDPSSEGITNYLPTI